jgi:hypothetical protein
MTKGRAVATSKALARPKAFFMTLGGPQAQYNENALGPAATFHITTTLSFVIPSVAEGSAVPRTLRGNVLVERSAVPFSI